MASDLAVRSRGDAPSSSRSNHSSHPRPVRSRIAASDVASGGGALPSVAPPSAASNAARAAV